VPGHSEPARCVALSRDGSQIASGSWDRSWKLWDATTGEKIFSVQGHDGQGQCICRMDKSGYCTAVDPTCGKVGHSGTVNAIAFSPSGARLATAGSDCLVILWLANGHAVERLEGHSKTVNAVCFSGDRHLASGSDDKTIRVWDAFKGLILHTLSDAHARGVSALCFSPDGRQLASAGGDKLVKLWDVEAWDEEHVLEGHDDRALALAWSPNSQQLASGGDDRSVWVWDARAGRRLHSMRGHDGAGGADGCKCARFGQLSEACALPGHREAVRSLSFSACGRTLASGSLDGMCKVWSASSGARLRAFSIGAEVTSVAILPHAGMAPPTPQQLAAREALKAQRASKVDAAALQEEARQQGGAPGAPGAPGGAQRARDQRGVALQGQQRPGSIIAALAAGAGVAGGPLGRGGGRAAPGGVRFLKPSVRALRGAPGAGAARAAAVDAAALAPDEGVGRSQSAPQRAASGGVARVISGAGAGAGAGARTASGAGAGQRLADVTVVRRIAVEQLDISVGQPPAPVRQEGAPVPER